MDSAERFSNRVENYRRYRPSYPTAIIDLIRDTAKLGPRDWVFLVWNERETGADSAFNHDYDILLDSLGEEYVKIQSKRTHRHLEAFFTPGTYQKRTFHNPQDMTWEVLRGRFLSSSYVPHEGDLRQPPLLVELERIFRQHEQSGKVMFRQDTHVYFGQL